MFFVFSLKNILLGDGFQIYHIYTYILLCWLFRKKYSKFVSQYTHICGYILGEKFLKNGFPVDITLPCTFLLFFILRQIYHSMENELSDQEFRRRNGRVLISSQDYWCFWMWDVDYVVNVSSFLVLFFHMLFFNIRLFMYL